MAANRSLLRALTRPLSLSSTFSTTTTAAAAGKPPNEKWSFYAADIGTGAKTHRPKTVQWNEHICNFASFVGTVTRPVQKFDTSSGRYGASTSLLVKPPSNPHRPFRILLKMWDEMADISLEHIKQNDFLHVSGRVESYTRTDENNTLQTFYEVIVKEINYIAECEQSPNSKKAEQLDSAGKSGLERSRARLRLWQLFFTNPSEWSDHRTNKTNPKHPDFKHKDTGEALWINDFDPPWVRTQLQLLDSKEPENKEKSTSSFSTFV